VIVMIRMCSYCHKSYGCTSPESRECKDCGHAMVCDLRMNLDLPLTHGCCDSCIPEMNRQFGLKAVNDNEDVA